MDTAELANRLSKLATELASIASELAKGGNRQPQPSGVEEKVSSGLCLNCGKPLNDRSSRPVRGCHESCYREIKNLIAQGAYSEAEAIANGLLLPKAGGGRPGKQTRAKELAENKALEATRELEKKLESKRK